MEDTDETQHGNSQHYTKLVQSATWTRSVMENTNLNRNTRGQRFSFKSLIDQSLWHETSTCV